MVAITAAYPILIYWYDVSSVSPFTGIPLSPPIKFGHFQLLYIFPLSVGSCVVYVYVFCSGFDCIEILFVLCIVMLCMYVLCYVSMVIVSFILCIWLYVYCSGAEEWHLPSTRVETINQSINQSIAINPVGDCSKMTVLGFRSSLLVNNNNNNTIIITIVHPRKIISEKV